MEEDFDEYVTVVRVQQLPPGHHPSQKPATLVSPTAKEAKKPTDFPYFSSLPPELQDEIWDYTVTNVDQRIFHAKLGPVQRQYNISFWNCPKPPAVLHACQASRALAKKRLSLIFNDKEGNGTWWNPEVDILYFDSDVRTSWSLARYNLINKGFNLSIQRIAIDWRICLTTLTPRRATAPGAQPYDGDKDFTRLIARFLKDYPSIKSIYIFFPEKQPINIFRASEPSAIKTIPIAGLTDITNESILLGDGISRLRTCVCKLSCPIFRGYWFKKLCSDASWLEKIINDKTIDLETRQFTMHRAWPAGLDLSGTKVTSHLPRPGQNGWRNDVPN